MANGEALGPNPSLLVIRISFVIPALSFVIFPMLRFLFAVRQVL